MVTPQDLAVIANLVAAAVLVIALAGFAVRRTKPWLFCSGLAFTVVIAATLFIVDLST